MLWQLKQPFLPLLTSVITPMNDLKCSGRCYVVILECAGSELMKIQPFGLKAPISSHSWRQSLVFSVSWLTLESVALAFNSSCSNNPILCFVNIQEKKTKDCLNKVSDFAFSENWVAVKLLLQQFSNSSKIFFSPSDLSYYFWAAVWPRTWWCSGLDHPFPVFSSVGDILSWVECSRMCWFGHKSGDSTGKDSKALFKLIQH